MNQTKTHSDKEITVTLQFNGGLSTLQLELLKAFDMSCILQIKYYKLVKIRMHLFWYISFHTNT
jgi:hypothetical protein